LTYGRTLDISARKKLKYGKSPAGISGSGTGAGERDSAYEVPGGETAVTADSGEVSSGSSSQNRSKNGSRVGNAVHGRLKSVAGRMAISLVNTGVTVAGRLSAGFRDLFGPPNAGTVALNLPTPGCFVARSEAGGDFALRLAPGARSLISTQDH
jgi:hypothetical protein